MTMIEIEFFRRTHMKPKLSKVLFNDYISFSLVLPGVIFSVVSLYGLFVEDVSTSITIIFLLIGVLLLLSGVIRLFIFSNHLGQIESNRTMAEIVSVSSFRRSLYITLSYVINGEGYKQKITTVKSSKSKALARQQQYVEIIYNPENPRKVYITELFYGESIDNKNE